MAQSRDIAIRRAQLISPFGVGAMVVGPDGTSALIGGLDRWFIHESGDPRFEVDPSEFEISEWRLQQEVQAERLMLPPDFRQPVRFGNERNVRLTVPLLRFPQWHFCPRCDSLTKVPLSSRERPECRYCEQASERRRRRPIPLAQVRFVAACDRGHLTDFPWREWVHRSLRPTCNARMRLVAMGGASLSNAQVICDCDPKRVRRSLAGIVEADPDGASSVLSDTLSQEGKYLCQGWQPWLGTEDPTECGRPVRGSLRGASNLYFSKIRTAIYLPRGGDRAPQSLVTTLEEPPLSTLVNILSSAGRSIDPQLLRGQHGSLLQPYSDNELAAALEIVTSAPSEQEAPTSDDDEETRFRRAEFDALRDPRQDDDLRISTAAIEDYGETVRSVFSRISLVESLRETRVFTGFGRIFPDDDLSADDRRAMLRRAGDSTSGSNWLPAYSVFGEGIFLEFDERAMSRWEKLEGVRSRVQPLVARHRSLRERRRLGRHQLSARFVLVHTFSHLLMNRLTYESGYSTAALRERLFVSDSPDHPMAGLLVYTAAGDSDGTLGGLVRLGAPGFLDETIEAALSGAAWCSADPICLEVGASGGQGPDSCNLAACHNCALVPETACEEFNRFLDRALLVSVGESTQTGFFVTDRALLV
ncbi:MAG: DUF1998 domain-containing protein [Dehalococcoidia bacterium]